MSSSRVSARHAVRARGKSSAAIFRSPAKQVRSCRAIFLGALTLRSSPQPFAEVSVSHKGVHARLRRAMGRGRVLNSWPSFETLSSPGRRQAPNKKVGAAINSDLMVRSPPKRKLRRASRTMARGTELAAILRDACLRQGEDKLLRMRGGVCFIRSGSACRWPTQDEAGARCDAGFMPQIANSFTFTSV